MPVSVTMPRLGESVTEGTVTRWLKNEGDHVDADEPLLEVSTDKVDTEIPSPASGTLLSIKVGEDETVEIGVELAVIGDAAEAGGSPESAPVEGAGDAVTPSGADAAVTSSGADAAVAPSGADAASTGEDAVEPAPPTPTAPAEDGGPAEASSAAVTDPDVTAAPETPPAPETSSAEPTAPEPIDQTPVGSTPAAEDRTTADPSARPGGDDDELAGTYVTPLVRKLASEHGVDLTSVQGTGVGGRIRKSDVLAASGGPAPQVAAPASQPDPVAAASVAVSSAPPSPAPVAASTPPPTASAPAVSSAPTVAASTPQRGRVEPMSRMRQVIAARMVESLQTSAQLTTVVEVDVTKISRLRQQARNDFQTREGVKLTFLPFFAVAAIEALRAHPIVNSSIDVVAKTITFHDAEHVVIAVDTERGLAVPVIHNAGDLNLGGIARKIADLAERTRANKVSPDELGGGTFTITNTGSRGALFDTPIINQPQVAILGTGAVVKRAVVVSDEELGETIAVRSMVYLALSYDHRIVDGADAARFLTTVKQRLEAGAFERALGLG